jgi:hypothetical protein
MSSPPECRNGAVDHRFDALGRTQVGCHADRAIVAAGAVGHVTARPLEGRRGSTAQAHEASFDGQRPGARQTEPAARARHDRYPVSKAQIHSVGIITERQYT